MKENQHIQVQGAHLRLVPYRPRHVDKYHAWMTDPELQELTRSEPLSLQEEYDMQHSWATDPNKCTFILLIDPCPHKTPDIDPTYGVVQSEVCKMIGDVNLFLVPDSATEAELNVMVAERSARGRRLGLESVCLLLIYAHQQLHIQSVLVKITRGNTPSITLFKDKLNFVQIGESEVFDEFTLQLCLDQTAMDKIELLCPHYELMPYND